MGFGFGFLDPSARVWVMVPGLGFCPQPTGFGFGISASADRVQAMVLGLGFRPLTGFMLWFWVEPTYRISGNGFYKTALLDLFTY